MWYFKLFVLKYEQYTGLNEKVMHLKMTLEAGCYHSVRSIDFFTTVVSFAYSHLIYQGVTGFVSRIENLYLSCQKIMNNSSKKTIRILGHIRLITGKGIVHPKTLNIYSPFILEDFDGSHWLTLYFSILYKSTVWLPTFLKISSFVLNRKYSLETTWSWVSDDRII